MLFSFRVIIHSSATFNKLEVQLNWQNLLNSYVQKSRVNEKKPLL